MKKLPILLILFLLFSLKVDAQEASNTHRFDLTGAIMMEHQEITFYPQLGIHYRRDPAFKYSGKVSYMPWNGEFFLFDLDFGYNVRKKNPLKDTYLYAGLNYFPAKWIKINNRRYRGQRLFGLNLGLTSDFKLFKIPVYFDVKGTLGQSRYYFIMAGIGYKLNIK